MPNGAATNYLQDTYKIFAKISGIIDAKDIYKTGNKINTSKVFTAIDNKVTKTEDEASESNFDKFTEEWEGCEELKKIPINILIVNPKYKEDVAELIKQINPEKPDLDAAAALDLIKKQLQEFFVLSQLADYASYSTFLSAWNNKDNLLTLGAMAKLQLCFVMDNLEKFFSHKKNNQEIQTIAETTIRFLGQSANAKGNLSTHTALKFYETNLDDVKKSFKEDKNCLQKVFDDYLKTIPINQNEEINDDEDEFYDALEIQAEDKFYDALEIQAEDEFYDALSSFEAKTGLVESAVPKDKKDKNPSNLEKFIMILKTCIFNMMEYPILFKFSHVLLVTLIKSIEIFQKTRQEATNPHGFFNNYPSQKEGIAAPFKCLAF